MCDVFDNTKEIRIHKINIFSYEFIRKSFQFENKSNLLKELLVYFSGVQPFYRGTLIDQNFSHTQCF